MLTNRKNGGGILANHKNKDEGVLTKKRNNGFAISGVLYPLLILTLFLVVQMLFMLQTRKNVLDKTRTELADSINASNKIYTNEELSALISDYKVELDKVKDVQSKTLLSVYPVESIYISYSKTNPETIFGGTWIAYGTGKTLVGVDTSQTEFDTIGKTGGEKSHVLTGNEMPSHSGHLNYFGAYSGTNGYYLDTPTLISLGAMRSYPNRPWTVTAGNELDTNTVNYGGNQAHNNMQPYVTVYMWRRTA